MDFRLECTWIEIGFTFKNRRFLQSLNYLVVIQFINGQHKRFLSVVDRRECF